MSRQNFSLMATMAVASLVFSCCDEDDDFIYNPSSPNYFSLTNVEVSSLPNMSLGAKVSFQTSNFARSWVEFCSSETDCWTTDIAETENFQTEHEILIIGMGPNADYTLMAAAENEEGNQVRSEVRDFQTGSLPHELDLEFQWERYDPNRADPDWILADIAYSDWHGPNVPVVFNQEGVPIWYADPWPGKDGDIAYQATWYKENVLIGGGIPEGERSVMVDLEGNFIWESAFIQSDMFSTGTTHHQFHPTSRDTVITLTMSGNDLNDTDILVEFDPDEFSRQDDEEFTLDQFEDMAEFYWVGYEHFSADDMNNYGNSVHVYPDDGEILYYGRERSMMFCIDIESKDIKWRFGQDSHPDTSHIIGDFSLDDGPFPSEAHGAKRLDNGHLIFYDNGFEDSEERHIRLVEFALDLDNLTAEVAWEWPTENEEDEWWNSGIGGDIIPLENENFLVFTGMDLEPQPHRIFELTRSGDIVWELHINGGHERGVYSGEKIPALARRIE